MDHTKKNIQVHLDTIGLSKSESEVVMFLLEIRTEWPVSGLAMELEQPRQTVNSTLRNLVKKGVIRVKSQNGVRHFQTDLTHLSEYVETKCKTLREAVLALNDCL